ncbi:hypothetical protein FJT64_020573 [Amphibalanus amphitrite]|uniref:Dr1-associated corepressor n=1 Tax=Amphibalanus amphitrite TaxID=1232801 RepID=A0A6A4WL88_AMPAM|nr:hypothetical protein FJT64_020573 [Amphibalanus amphitrite]
MQKPTRKHCIQTEQRFDFLRELVEDIPDATESEEAAGSSSAAARTAASTSAAAAARSVGRPPKYLKMDIPPRGSVPSSTNGPPHSAPPGRPPVPGLIHTSLLGLTGGAVSAAATVPGEPYSPLALATSVTPQPPPAHGGPAQPPAQPPAAHCGPARPPPLAVRYGSVTDTDGPEGL